MVQVSQLIGAVRFIYGLLEDCMVHLRPVGRPYGSSMARWKAVQFIVWFIYGLSEGCMVHLRPVSRPHGSTTARWKAVRFIYSPSEGHTVYFTDRKQDLRPAWNTIWKAAQKTPQEEFPM